MLLDGPFSLQAKTLLSAYMANEIIFTVVVSPVPLLSGKPFIASFKLAHRELWLVFLVLLAFLHNFH